MQLSQSPSNLSSQPSNRTTAQNASSAQNIAAALNWSDPKVFYPNYQKYRFLAKVIFTKQKILEILKKSKLDTSVLKNIIYNFLVNRNEYFLMKEKLTEFYEKNPGARNWYQNTRDIIENNLDWKTLRSSSNPGWFGINTNPEAHNHTKLDYKIYTTIAMKDYGFIRHIPSLANKLREISLKNGDIINLKIPYAFTAFASHNDSIVVHFKNKDSEQEILQAIDSRLRQNNIVEMPREFGRSKRAVEANWDSFSDLVSENIAKWLVDHKGKFDDEVLAQWAIHYAIDLSQKIPSINWQ